MIFARNILRRYNYFAVTALIAFIVLLRMIANSKVIFQKPTALKLDVNSYQYPIHKLPLNDYQNLIGLKFRFLINNEVCKGSKPLVIIIVHSAAVNFSKRKVIRETWGQQDEQFKLIFAVGIDNTLHDVKRGLQLESEIFKDIVQGNFVDHYRNMTYKHTMVFKYVIYHCPQAKYILKTDDDVFVNIPMVKSFFSSLSLYGAKDMLLCSVVEKRKVNRSFRVSGNSKWRLSHADFPHTYFPEHCPGFALMYSQDVVFNLYRESQKTTKFLWIDDVYITGILAKKLEVRLTDFSSLVLTKNSLYKFIYKSHDLPQYFLVSQHRITEKIMRKLWTYINRRKVKDFPKLVK